MFKLMHKKLNKKGFTLAELLVVVAVIAVLVAIAIPIFTQALQRAQIRTNDANIRSTKAAAVEAILDDWATYGAGSKSATPEGHGWWAVGHVTKRGDLTEVRVYMSKGGLNAAATKVKHAIIPGADGLADSLPAAGSTVTNAVLTDKNPVAASSEINSAYATTAIDANYGYWTLVYIDEVQDKTS